MNATGLRRAYQACQDGGMAVKQCSWEGCGELAAYGTRTKPSWCDAHITAILREGGLEPLEPFTKPTAYRMTRCLTCGCEAHYRFVYTLDKNAEREPTCRACFWAVWIIWAQSMGGRPSELDPVSEDEVREHAEANGFDYLGRSPRPPSFRTRCRYCGRVSVDRLGDIGWGCSCQVNPKRAVKPAATNPGQAPDVVARMSPELVEQWHPTANGKLQVQDISPVSKRQITWRDPVCGHEWVARPVDREKRERLRCPECRTILDSLAWHFPALAEEWASTNPLSPWHVRPNATLTFVPEWVCSAVPEHRWQMSANVRTHGSTCPLCRESGKSMVELRYFEAVRDAFDTAFSGLTVRSEFFARRSSWVPDMTVELAGGRTMFVEYDGSYWHADKAVIDREKSADLLATGALVVRLRETPLPSLALQSRDYLELTVQSAAPNPVRAVAAIQDWLLTVGTPQNPAENPADRAPLA
ncbi:zinc-ribbon domain-containing protein [Pseudoclavibacter terrae]|uniref:zinc-ribbon domain-containing protein n=1 Tax=Pseudoclavibacter terrae TaxID=1530195 RepID=UPI002FE3F100